jgi:addiction module HigA family antidote
LDFSPYARAHELRLRLFEADATRQVPYPTPGEILRTEFLEPLGISQYRLARAIGVPQVRIGQIVAGTRAVSVDTGLRWLRYFGLNDGFWVGLQLDYDAAVAKDRLAAELDRITPHELEAA